jgi:hypothetical protein
MRVTEMVEPLGQGCQTRTLVQPDQAFGEPLLSGQRQGLDHVCHRVA